MTDQPTTKPSDLIYEDLGGWLRWLEQPQPDMAAVAASKTN